MSCLYVIVTYLTYTYLNHIARFLILVWIRICRYRLDSLSEEQKEDMTTTIIIVITS
jgi:hypothetical protein